MDAAQPDPSERSYGCTFGCGNPYDFVFISIRDGTTEFLCVPCFVRLASDIVSAVVEADSDMTAKWLDSGASLLQSPMRGRSARAGRRNAPATNQDPDLIDAYDSRIGAGDLPAEFR